VLEERSVGPIDSSGATRINGLALTPDGRSVAFSYRHTVGSLHILRGLWRPSD
jgi:hypothetical protein